MPFLEEFRDLCDWTVTTTSMDLFMWLKLEDAQQNLYLTKCMIEARYPQATPQPWSDKIIFGFLFLFVLFLLIVGPISFFSTLNQFRQPQLVTAASLNLNLKIQSEGERGGTVPLYTTALAEVKSVTGGNRTSFFSRFLDIGDQPVDVQNVSFPEYSDNLWLISPALRNDMAHLLNSSINSPSFVLEYSFLRNQSETAVGRVAVPIVQDQIEQLVSVLKNGSNASITIAGLFRPYLKLASSTVPAALQPVLPSENQTFDALLTLHSTPPYQFWSLQQEPPADGECVFPGVCDLRYSCVSEQGVIGAGSSGSSGGESMTVVGIYVTVVLTIGRFLRMIFQDSSKRVIYEELDNTSKLTDICNGIYVARLIGELETESKLYYELLRIYRSPQLLLDISAPMSTEQQQQQQHKSTNVTGSTSPQGPSAPSSGAQADSERAPVQTHAVSLSLDGRRNLTRRRLGVPASTPTGRLSLSPTSDD